MNLLKVREEIEIILSSIKELNNSIEILRTKLIGLREEERKIIEDKRIFCDSKVTYELTKGECDILNKRGFSCSPGQEKNEKMKEALFKAGKEPSGVIPSFSLVNIE